MATYLDRIVAAHRRAAGLDQRSFSALYDAAEAVAAGRRFVAALAGTDSLAVIAEIKRQSPSRGPLAPDLDPGELAATYQLGGAAALSVLTDAEFFAGTPADLIAARQGCALPVLRKDFTVDRRDVLDAKLMGADAVLLIVAALDEDELVSLVSLAHEIGLDALVEVHDEAEVDRARRAGARLIGVNQRDLTTFEVDRDLARRLRPLLGGDVVAVAESGVTSAGEARDLADAGYQAVLVGEALVTSSDPAGAVAALRGARVAS